MSVIAAPYKELVRWAVLRPRSSRCLLRHGACLHVSYLRGPGKRARAVTPVQGLLTQEESALLGSSEAEDTRRPREDWLLSHEACPKIFPIGTCDRGIEEWAEVGSKSP